MENENLQEVNGNDNILELLEGIEIEKDSLLYDVKRGLEGKNEGIQCELPELNKYLHGVQRETFYLVGAGSTVGKSTFTNFFFFLSVYFYCKDNNIPFTLVYYSFEISKRKLRAKIAGYLVNKRHSIRISLSKILGNDSKKKMSREELEYVIKVNDEVDEIFDSIIFVDTPTNPTGINKHLMSILAELGTFHKEHYTKTSNNISEDKEKIVGYDFHEENRLFVVVLDHASLLVKEQGFTLKETIDKAGEYFVRLRNLCKISPVLIQQFNSDLGSTYRQQKTEQDVAPTQLDFADSKYSFNNCDVAIGLVNPTMFDLSKFGQYKMDKMNNRFRAGFLLKNRDDDALVQFPMLMDAVSGVFYELRKEDVNAEYLEQIYEVAKYL